MGLIMRNKIIFMLVSGFLLAGCKDNPSNIEGVYAYENKYGSPVEIIIDKKDAGYNVEIKSTSKRTGAVTSFDWGSVVHRGDFMVRSSDDAKVFEIISEDEIKRVDNRGKETAIKVK